MGQCDDLRKTARYRDVSKFQLKANGPQYERDRSRGWNRESKNPGTSRVCSRFHSRRRKCQLSMRRICTIQPTRTERRQLQIAYQKAALSAKPIQNRRSHRTAHHRRITINTICHQSSYRQTRACQSLIYSDNDPHHRVAPSDANKFVNPRVRLRCMRLFVGIIAVRESRHLSQRQSGFHSTKFPCNLYASGNCPGHPLNLFEI